MKHARTILTGLLSLSLCLAAYSVLLQRGPDRTVAFQTRGDNRYERAQRKTVLIRTIRAQGSGIVVKRANSEGQTRVFVWTAAHVVADVNTAQVVVKFRREGHKAGEAVFEGVVILRPSVDAALLLVNADPRFFDDAEFDFDLPKVGTPVYHVGNILGENFDGSVTTGVVSQLGVKPEHIEGWPWPVLDQADALMWHGSSGGPVFRSRNDKVLGICVAGPELPGVSCYLPVREIVKAVPGMEWTLRGDWCPRDSTLDLMKKNATVPESVLIFLFFGEEVDGHGCW